MGALDELLSSATGGLWVVLGIAFVLGIRHAGDPDHLVAVSTLVAGADERRTRRAARLGAAWGMGHALTVLVFGLPVVLLHAHIPAAVERFAEVLIGGIITLLALRLLRAWRGGAFHAHEHEHEGARHAHLHTHATSNAHVHVHPARTARQSFAIGAVHGLAGSASVTVLLLAAVPDRAVAAVALAVLAAGAAISMTLVSSALGLLLGTVRGRRSLRVAAPALGVVAAAFGACYAVAAFA